MDTSRLNRNCSRRPRILHLVPADGIGGVEIAAKSMLARPDLECEFRLQFIEPAPPKSRTFGSAVRALGAHWRALGPARAFAPDVILCSLWRSVPLALALRALLPRARLVYFIHIDAAVHRADAMFAAIAMRAADAIWGDSHAALVARGATPAKSRVISFVTDRLAIADKGFQGPRFVSWGRLNRQKGFDRAIRFIGLLVERGIDARYDLYGPDDGERDALAALIADLGLGARVNLMGPIARHALPGVAAENSFFLQPSRSEGMCMAAVEAMQHGLVPVVTPVGEMARYVIPGETGIVIDPDRMEPAAAEVAMLIGNRQEWERQSAAAMRHWHGAPLYAEDVCHAAAELAATSD